MTFQNKLIDSFEQHDERIAITGQGKDTTYGALLRQANKITHYLLDQRVSPETYVGIMLRQTDALISAIIGIANARCVFVPLDASLPAARLQSMIEALDLRYLICAQDIPAEGVAQVENKYFIDALPEIPGAGRPQYPDFDKEDSLYVYFTSGSTGIPKGIIGRNSGLLHFIDWEIETFQIDNSVRCSQLISPYFDAFLRDIFVPLFAGGTICLPPPESDFSTPADMIRWIDEQQISLIHCVPSVFRIFNDKILNESNFSALKHILLSGERVIPSELSRWYNIFGSRIQLVNLYGTTETTMIKSYYELQPADAAKSRIPIGRPIADTYLFIANDQLQECSLLVQGDLYIVSDFITKGYLGNEELNREKFVLMDLGDGQARCAFKTGDKARKLANGMIDLLGRQDRQVKLRGIRIELDEVEALLAGCPEFEQVVVLKVEENNIQTTNSTSGDPSSLQHEQLVAFVTRREGSPKQKDIYQKLITYAKAHLPAYMIPTDVVVIDALPLLANGKTDYRQLLAIFKEQELKLRVPQNETEEQLLAIWKSILGDKPISTDQEFHRIGGSSLSIMKLTAYIYKAFNVRISLRDLFNNPTIIQQANFISQAKTEDIWQIQPVPEKPAYQLSAVQERMYYNYELNKSGKAYNLPMILETIGQLDIAKLEACFSQLVERHESLRTSFNITEDQLVQVVHEQVNFGLRYLRSSSWSGSLDELINQEAIRPFDLAKPPLLNVTVIETEAQRHLLIMDTHHIICDGISQIILLTEASLLYNGSKLAPLSIQLKDYAEWENNYKKTQDYLMHRAFWLESLEGDLPRLELPSLNQNKTERSQEGDRISFDLPPGVGKQLQEFAGLNELTLFSVLFSAYLLYLSQITGQDDIVIGINTSGRLHSELDSVVGMFAKTLPIRRQLTGNLTFRTLAIDVHKQLVEANTRQIYDLADMVNGLNHRQASPELSLFDTMFVFQNFEKNEIPINGIQSRPYKSRDIHCKYPLVLVGSEHEGALFFSFEYATAYFTAEDMHLLAGQFQQLLQQLATHPDRQLVQYLSDDEKQMQLMEEEVSFDF